MRLTGILKPTFWKVVGVILVAGCFVSLIQRYSMGLGATTNMRDTFPWGLWIGFDMLVGVGLAAGGFCIAATVYLFNLERFRPILRPTILTAFLGYLLAICGLLADLGRPWFIWHAMIMWNPRSVMFEVAWCVMLYTAVLALEFSPVVLEKFKLTKPLKVVHAITIPLVVVGVILSTLHQSSLGSLFVVIPGRMHPLWYSNIIPFLFIISCVAAGLSMTIVESFLSARVFGRDIELPLLTDLARVIVVLLGLYLIVRIQDLMSRDALRYVFEISYQSILFLGEIVLGVILPMVLLAIRKVRTSKTGLFYSAVLAVLGFIAHRVNTTVTSLEHFPDRMYLPTIQEYLVTAGLTALGFIAFGLIAKYFNVFQHEVEPQQKQEPVKAEAAVEFSPVTVK
jgi:Ni/Fe-hydrogenase subunit HybB-like protein